jgi:uncharacterized membrane protein
MTGSGKTSTGFDQNFAAALTYVFGAVTGIVFLLIEKENRFVRFHALQSTIAFLIVMVLDVLVRNAPLAARFMHWVFVVAVLVLWIFLMARAFRGEAYKLPYVGEWAERELR